MLATLSLTQALPLWSELERAYYDDNKYGGTIAEIYIYRLMPYSPILASSRPGLTSGTGLAADACREAYDAANTALYDLLTLFVKERPKCRIQVEDQELGPWLKTARYEHRVHVQVIRL